MTRRLVLLLVILGVVAASAAAAGWLGHPESRAAADAAGTAACLGGNPHQDEVDGLLELLLERAGER